MRTAYDFNKLTKEDKQILQTINKLKYQEHAWEHHASCFKKGPECRFHFAKLKTDLKLEISEENAEWTELDKENQCVKSFDIVTKQCLGDAYVNVHSKACSEILAFNNNVAIGDAQQIFYCTNYSTKHTQEEDRFEYMMMCAALGRRFEKMKTTEEIKNENKDLDFKKGMGNLISGIRAHVASNVIMANMASLLTMVDSRFLFSHNFPYILVTQIQNYFNTKETQFRVQKTKDDGKRVRRWADLYHNDVIFRPEELENFCVYEISMWFERIPMTKKRISEMKLRRENNDFKSYKSIEMIESGTILYFQPEHLGQEIVCLQKLKNFRVPKIFRNKDIDFNHLLVSENHVNDHVISLREHYAQVALILFLPFRDNIDLLSKEDNTYWSSFWGIKERKCGKMASGSYRIFKIFLI